MAGVADLDGDEDGVQGRVGGAELAAEVVAVLADLAGDLAGLAELLVGPPSVVVACRRHGEDQVKRTAKRLRLGRGLLLAKAGEHGVGHGLDLGNGITPVEQLIEDWYELARQCGITVHDEHGDLLPEVDDAITRTVTSAIWFGLTTGFLTLTEGRYQIPRKFAVYV